MTTADEVEQLQTTIDAAGETISRLSTRLAGTEANWERQISEIVAALGGADSGADGAVAATARRMVRERDEEHRARRHYWDEVRALGEVLRRIREAAGYRTGVDAHALAAVGRVVRERDEARELAQARTGLAVQLAEARATIERVRVLHQPTDGMGYRDGDYGEMAPVCTTCGTAVEYGVPYPCATLAALDGRDGE